MIYVIKKNGWYYINTEDKTISFEYDTLDDLFGTSLLDYSVKYRDVTDGMINDEFKKNESNETFKLTKQEFLEMS